MMNNSQSVQSLSDEQYEQLGKEWMEVMMGEGHEDMDKQMEETLGEDGLRQMHITMGKRIQNPNDLKSLHTNQTIIGSFGRHHMDNGHWQAYQIAAVVTWVICIAFLLAGIRYFWKKASK